MAAQPWRLVVGWFVGLHQPNINNIPIEKTIIAPKMTITFQVFDVIGLPHFGHFPQGEAAVPQFEHKAFGGGITTQ